MKFTLIVATYKREYLLENFLNSLLSQKYKKFEVILIDQDKESSLKEKCIQYKEKYNLDLIYKYSNKKGLSISRNIGLNFAKGDIIAFPDDDCEYYPDTLLEVYNYFQSNNIADVVLGKIVDKNGKNIIRKWPQKIIEIDQHNFFLKYSSITLFLKNYQVLLKFCEELGVGSFFGSYEDADYVYRLLLSKKRIFYSPNIKVYHPKINKDDLKKMYSYGLGFGYFCRRNLSLSTFFLFLKVIIYHSFLFFKGLLKFDRKLIERSKYSIKSRIKGFSRIKK